ncbi:Cytohesin-2 [Camelus dromedarius]|uniref:Cytohesin-2 n=1 Tax=Camelus dromedarius TaxID=9838 RepID=A0A5N4DG31_CAMDR|nr:Cytohesin-2 [Camelus dromedarius]
MKTWKQHWFILMDNCLYCFEYTMDKGPGGIIPLKNLSIREVDDTQEPKCFELYVSTKGQLIKADKMEAGGWMVEVYLPRAPMQEEDQRIKSIQAIVSAGPFHELLAARKKGISVKKKQEQPCPFAPKSIIYYGAACPGS